MKHLALSIVLASLTCSPLVQAAASMSHYSYGTEGFSVDLDKAWIADMQEGALKNWDMGEMHLEIYAYPSSQAKNLRRYIAKEDAASRTSCDGKPAMTVLKAEWVIVGGHRALMRHELSCMTGSDLYVTYASDKKFIAEIVMNKPSAGTNSSVTLVDEHGKFISDLEVNNPPRAILTDADAALYGKILQSFRFLSDAQR